MAESPMNHAMAMRRTPAQVEDDRLQLTYLMRDVLMRRHGFGEQVATDAADACVTALAGLEGNELASALSAFRQEARRRRDEAVRAELRPGNAEDVGRRHHLSVRRVYEIARRRSPPK